MGLLGFFGLEVNGRVEGGVVWHLCSNQGCGAPGRAIAKPLRGAPVAHHREPAGSRRYVTPPSWRCFSEPGQAAASRCEAEILRGTQTNSALELQGAPRSRYCSLEDRVINRGVCSSRLEANYARLVGKKAPVALHEAPRDRRKRVGCAAAVRICPRLRVGELVRAADPVSRPIALQTTKATASASISRMRLVVLLWRSSLSFFLSSCFGESPLPPPTAGGVRRGGRNSGQKRRDWRVQIGTGRTPE